VAITCLVGLLLALLTERVSERLPVVQTILLAPWAVPVIVVAFLFRYIFDQESGGANALLIALHVIARPLPWLANGPLAMAALILANVWSQAPFFILVFLAALRGIPDHIVDAARVDGADELSIARHIKVPHVMGALVPAVLVAVITNFNNFTLVWSMTEGGPAYDTTTLVVYVYRLAFTQFNVGYASAVGAIWLAVLIVFATLFVRVTASRTETA
jgi:ABC-type sugar transport system permease subunit